MNEESRKDIVDQLAAMLATCHRDQRRKLDDLVRVQDADDDDHDLAEALREAVKQECRGR